MGSLVAEGACRRRAFATGGYELPQALGKEPRLDFPAAPHAADAPNPKACFSNICLGVLVVYRIFKGPRSLLSLSPIDFSNFLDFY